MRVIVVDLKMGIMWQLNMIVRQGKSGQGGFGYEIHQ